MNRGADARRGVSVSDSAEKKKPKRPRGTGCMYKRAGSTVWWIKYSRSGKTFSESTHTTSEYKAGRILARRLGEVASGTFLPPAIERIRVQELMDDLLRDYRINKRKSIEDAETRWKLHLKPAFAHLRASDLCRTDEIERYVESRQKEGAANATINREMSLLKRAFHLARTNNRKKVREVPVFPHLKEAPPRRGFLEDSAYCKLVEGSPLWFRTAVEVGRKFAWRVSEVLNLRVAQIDLFGRTIRLHAGETKNDEARTVPIPDSLYPLLLECVRGKRPEQSVFTRSNGEPIGDFRWTWWRACVRAGVGRIFCPSCEQLIDSRCCPKCRVRSRYKGLLFHDLRRTGARNLRRSGVAEGVIMKIGGWKTRSVFERYNIVSESDLADAMRKLEEQEKKLQQLQRPRLQLSDSAGNIAPEMRQVANRQALN
jgi:integrase